MRALADLPYIGSRLVDRPGLQAIIANMGWLFADKVVRMGMALVVGVWIARYLGPRQFGLLNYAMAFSALFGPIATLGLDKVVVLELVKRPEERDALLGSAFVLLVLSGLAALGCSVAVIAVARPDDRLAVWMVAIFSVAFVFQSLNVIDFYFQSLMRSKYTVCAANSAFLFVALVKVALILYKAPLIAFAWAGLAELALTAVFLTIAYRYNQGRIRTWRFNRQIARSLLKDTWPLILSGLAIMIYMRIDQIMLGQMKGDWEVGIFSAAVRISEVWYFIPMAVSTSVYPAIIRAKASQGDKSYYRKLQKLLDVMVFSAAAVAIVATILSPFIIRVLYGANYAAAARVLSLHVWAGVFVCLGVIGGNWFMAENLQKYLFVKAVCGAIMNVGMNLFMIPLYGAQGAAISTIVSQGFASVFFNAFLSKTRPIFWLQIKSLFQYNALKRLAMGRTS